MKVFIKGGVKVGVDNPSVYHKYIENGWTEFVRECPKQPKAIQKQPQEETPKTTTRKRKI